MATEPTEATKEKNKCNISSLKLRENFLYEIKNEEKDINEEIFKDFFYQIPSYLAKRLYDSDEFKNDEILEHINNGLILLKKYSNLINNKKVKDILRT